MLAPTPFSIERDEEVDKREGHTQRVREKEMARDRWIGDKLKDRDTFTL